jgi:hypothetical protein
MQAASLNASRAMAVAPSARVSRPVVRVSRSSGAAAARVAARRLVTRSTAVETAETASVTVNGNGHGAAANGTAKGSAKKLIEVSLRYLVHCLAAKTHSMHRFLHGRVHNVLTDPFGPSGCCECSWLDLSVRTAATTSSAFFIRQHHIPAMRPLTTKQQNEHCVNKACAASPPFIPGPLPGNTAYLCTTDCCLHSLRLQPTVICP